jgi:hypothetical protein
MTPRRTEFAAFVLDLLDFVEEKIGEAMENEPSRVAAIGEAAGAIPVVRDRLRENDLANTQCILALGNMIEQRSPSAFSFSNGVQTLSNTSPDSPSRFSSHHKRSRSNYQLVYLHRPSEYELCSGVCYIYISI